MVGRPLPQWEEWRQTYIEYLENQVGVKSAIEYVGEFGKEEASSDRELNEVLLNMGEDLSGFERVFPALNQDVAVVMVNPGMRWRGSTSSDERWNDDNYLLSREDLDALERRIAISMDGAAGWLSRKEPRDPEERNIRYERVYNQGIKKIAELTDTIDSFKADPRNTAKFFSEVYYTNWYKFATREQKDIPNGLKKQPSGEFPSHILRSELSIVDPKLVLLFGKLPWLAMKPFCEGENSAAPNTRKITKAHGHIYRWDRNDSPTIVAPLIFPSGRNRQHFSSEKDANLEKNLRDLGI